MSFGFGGVSAKTTSLKHLDKKVNNCIVSEHFDVTEEDFYIFLVEQKPDNTRMNLLIQEINKVGYKSYLILSASSCAIKKDDMKKDGYVNFYEQNESNWKKYIDYNGAHCRAILAFGPAMYAINKDADLQPEHFLSFKFVKPYYYIGHGFIGDLDCFVYPTYSLDEVWPVNKKGIGAACWVTRWTIDQMKRMLHDEQEYPDMRPYKIIVAED